MRRPERWSVNKEMACAARKLTRTLASLLLALPIGCSTSEPDITPGGGARNDDAALVIDCDASDSDTLPEFGYFNATIDRVVLRPLVQRRMSRIEAAGTFEVYDGLLDWWFGEALSIDSDQMFGTAEAELNPDGIPLQHPRWIKFEFASGFDPEQSAFVGLRIDLIDKAATMDLKREGDIASFRSTCSLR